MNKGITLFFRFLARVVVAFMVLQLGRAWGLYTPRIVYEPIKSARTAEVETVVEMATEVYIPYTAIPTEDLGEYTVTAYCSCYDCCEEYALNRPVLNGEEIVFTSTGMIAQDNVTVATDPENISYGTAVFIEGVGVRIVQDCGGSIKGNRIDVYFSNHQDALEFGRRTANVWKINIEEN